MSLISTIPNVTAGLDDSASEARSRIAAARAAANYAGNFTAIRSIQPGLADRLRGVACDERWTFARDNALTARSENGMWLAGCSVPRAAARAMLKKLEGDGTTACFLRPFHAAALRLALDQRKPEQAIIAIVPDEAELAVMIHCEDFSFDLAHHRLWFVAGTDWAAQLGQLLSERPGLPTPAQFIRLRDGHEDAADALIEPARQIISHQVEGRGRIIAALRGGPRAFCASITDPSQVCIIAPSRFRLWDDAGHSLGQIAGELGGTRFDTDDPASASPLALAQRIADSDVVIGMNATRAEAKSVAPLEVPWITWLTTPRIPAYSSAGPRDRLIVVDEAWHALTEAAGWPADRIDVATLPPLDIDPSAPSADRAVTILCDTTPLDPPAKVVEMSSHRLLWELIRDEVLANPFTIGPDLSNYLDRWLRRSGIARESIDRVLLIDALIAPAFAQGLVRMLHAAQVPLRIFGSGWRAIAPAAWHGPTSTREAFLQAVQSATALLHVWPTTGFHPIDHVGRPVVGRAADRQSLLIECQRAISNPSPTPRPVARNPISTQRVREILARASIALS